MKLNNIKRSYNIVVSLGCNCSTATHLKRNDLRRFSMPLDWMKSPSLSDVIRLLKNKFNGFMEFNNLILLGRSAHTVEGIEHDEEVRPNSIATFLVANKTYNIYFFHDFIVIPNHDWSVTYPVVKDKYNRRINRFLNKIKNSESVLFVRQRATIDETIELQSVLSQLTNGKFNLLIVNLGLSSVIIEQDWGIPNVCSVEIPELNGEDVGIHSAWDYILSGITIDE